MYQVSTNKTGLNKMRLDISSLLFSLSTALDFVEQEVVGVSHNHCRRVACVSAALCQHMGMNEVEIMDMTICAVLHDSALTETNLDIRFDNDADQGMWKHCDLGERNVSKFPFFQGDVKNIVLWHHENWNGSGYLGLRGNEISERAAILRLADNADLLFNMGNEVHGYQDLFAHLAEKSGILYSPKVIEAFFDCIDEDFLFTLKDDQIDKTIKKILPPMLKEVSTKQLLELGCVFSGIIDSKSPFTSTHSQGLVRTAEIMSNHYGFDKQRTETLMLAAHLHDLGKLMVPATILEKAAPLDEDEFTIMKTHAQGTYDLLSMVEGMETVCDWASQHHEKLDGTGYPLKLDAGSLCFEARLMGCIDMYQALTENRPYRKGMTHTEVMIILRNFAEAGKVEMKIVEDMDKVMQSELAQNWPTNGCRSKNKYIYDIDV